MQRKELAINEFIGRLNQFASRKLPVHEVHDFLQESTVSQPELESYLFYDSKQYTRNLIHKSEEFELLAICWQPGQEAPVHGHEGEKCWSVVAMGKALPKIPMVRSAVLIGSIAPDIPFYLLTLGSFLYFQNVLGWPRNEAARDIFRTLYFEDPVWIACQSLLHSPLSLLCGLFVIRLLKTRWSHFSNWMQWFLMACLLHSFVDIATHYEDGPVLFWPLNWTIRFHSPISYWDRDHFGREFRTFEFIFDLSLVGYLFFSWFRRPQPPLSPQAD